ncbi:hypothetical protein RJ45_09630 [Photobacterium gaetbulicola]|uniref:Lipoprotein n=1 Tax=Photobacterium gaetbulicola TaxID=1295392 RepID=A0A0B9GGG1_9GAMM|nr:hypothetical protein [Photobacterium gaetbulicola]KHT63855.1 hypothetical protein RJ45_09630 [Photobacterium gaetbulicola]
MGKFFVVLLGCLLLVACGSQHYAKPTIDDSKDIASLSAQYVNATRGGGWDFTSLLPGKVYHPRDGYIHYKRLWCLDEGRGSIEEFQRFMADICTSKGGKMDAEWCISNTHNYPVFRALIEPTGTTCSGGNIAASVDTIEPISSSTASEWRLYAEKKGFVPPQR